MKNYSHVFWMWLRDLLELEDMNLIYSDNVTDVFSLILGSLITKKKKKKKIIFDRSNWKSRVAVYYNVMIVR